MAEKEDKPRHQAQAENAAARTAAVIAGAEKRKRAKQNLLRAVDDILKTDAGRIFWAHLHDVTGYAVSSLTRKSDGEIAVLSTECKEAQRLIYINLRKLVKRDLLGQIESGFEIDGQEPE